MTLSIGGLKTFQHDQTIPATSWTIIHNFESKPISEFWVYQHGTLVKAFPNSIVHINENTLNVVWTQPRTGIAYLVK